MSKKSKKILAYLMFVAALCGTPAVSEARGGSGGQVKTEKASAISYFFKNYGWETLKLLGVGGGSYGAAKFSKAGDFSTWASYLFDMKNADLQKAQKLMNEFKEEKKKFENEKNLFEQNKAKALNDNTKLNNEKVAFELSNKGLNAKVTESEKKIKELEDSKAKLDNEVLNLKNYNNQLINLTNEDNEKIDALLSGLLSYKMSGEFVGSYIDNSWEICEVNNLEPYSNSQGVITVAFVSYDSDGNMIGNAEELKLGTGSFFDEVRKKAEKLLKQDATDVSFASKDVGLGYCDVPYLARCSFILKDENENVKKVVAAYFPLKSFQAVDNVENN